MLAVLLYILFVVVGLRFFEPALLGAVLSLIGVLWLAIGYWRHRDLAELLVPAAATMIGLAVWLMESSLLFTLLPVFISLFFFIKFLDATLRNRPFLADMVKKVPKVNLNEEKLRYIDRSHAYWAAVNGVNVTIQIAMVFAPLTWWALYSTLGWYLLFGLALSTQIIYGKLHGI